MKLFKVNRTDNVDWTEDIECIVLANDAMWAEKLARLSSDNFKKAKLATEEIDTNTEGVLLTTNKGA